MTHLPKLVMLSGCNALPCPGIYMFENVVNSGRMQQIDINIKGTNASMHNISHIIITATIPIPAKITHIR